MINENISNGKVEPENSKPRNARRALCRLRADSLLGRLPPSQRAQVDRWLFDLHESYDRVVQRCQEELHLTISKAAVHRYHKRRELLEPRATNAGNTLDPLAIAVQADQTYLQVIETIGQIALRLARLPSEQLNPRDLADLTRLLIASRREGHEALRAGTTREKFEFDTATACLAHQLELNRIAADGSVDNGKKILAIRERLFGSNLPE